MLLAFLFSIFPNVLLRRDWPRFEEFNIISHSQIDIEKLEGIIMIISGIMIILVSGG